MLGRNSALIAPSDCPSGSDTRDVSSPAAPAAASSAFQTNVDTTWSVWSMGIVRMTLHSGFPVSIGRGVEM